MPNGLAEILTVAGIVIPFFLVLNWCAKRQVEKDRKKAAEEQVVLDEILAGLRKTRLSQEEMLRDMRTNGH